MAGNPGNDCRPAPKPAGSRCCPPVDDKLVDSVALRLVEFSILTGVEVLYLGMSFDEACVLLALVACGRLASNSALHFAEQFNCLSIKSLVAWRNSCLRVMISIGGNTGLGTDHDDMPDCTLSEYSGAIERARACSYLTRLRHRTGYA